MIQKLQRDIAINFYEMEILKEAIIERKLIPLVLGVEKAINKNSAEVVEVKDYLAKLREELELVVRRASKSKDRISKLETDTATAVETVVEHSNVIT